MVPEEYIDEVIDNLITTDAVLKNMTNINGVMTLNIDISSKEILEFKNWLLKATNYQGKVELN